MKSTNKQLGLTFVALLVFAVVGVRLGSSSARAGVTEPQYLAEPKAQTDAVNIQVLKVRREPTEMMLPFDSAVEPPQLKEPISIEVSPDEHVFAVDQTNGIFEYSPNGGFHGAFKKSSEPKIQSVTDLVLTTRRISIADLIGKAIHTYDRENGAWKTLNLNDEPYRLEPTGRDSFFVMRIGNSMLFDEIESSGEKLGSFGVLLQDQGWTSLALDGFIARSGVRMIYCAKYLGILASYETDRRLGWAVGTIAPPDKALIAYSSTTRSVQRPSLPACESLSADGASFGVLTRRINGLGVSSYLDLYREADGAYYKSLQLPAVGSRWSSVAIGNEYLFAANGLGLYSWPKSVLSANAQSNVLSAGRVVVSFNKTTKGEQR